MVCFLLRFLLLFCISISCFVTCVIDVALAYFVDNQKFPAACDKIDWLPKILEFNTLENFFGEPIAEPTEVAEESDFERPEADGDSSSMISISIIYLVVHLLRSFIYRRSRIGL